MVNQDHVDYLVGLSFSPDLARQAVIDSKGDQERALELAIHASHGPASPPEDNKADCRICAAEVANAAEASQTLIEVRKRMNSGRLSCVHVPFLEALRRKGFHREIAARALYLSGGDLNIAKKYSFHIQQGHILLNGACDRCDAAWSRVGPLPESKEKAAMDRNVIAQAMRDENSLAILRALGHTPQVSKVALRDGRGDLLLAADLADHISAGHSRNLPQQPTGCLACIEERGRVDAEEARKRMLEHDRQVTKAHRALKGRKSGGCSGGGGSTGGGCSSSCGGGGCGGS